jgi:hypothetical protein
MNPNPRNLKEWNLFRMASGYVYPTPTLEQLYWFIDRYPDECIICRGAGEVRVGIATPFGILVEKGLCPACHGEGVEGWYSTN